MNQSDAGQVFYDLEAEEDISLETVAALTGEELEAYFFEYVSIEGGRLSN